MNGLRYTLLLATLVPALFVASVQAQQRNDEAPPDAPSRQTNGERSARVFGLGPKFNVVEGENPRPLDTGDKFRLFVADSTRPYQFLVAGAVAGVSMTDSDNRGFGQGAEGFGKRFGAAMADQASSNFFGTFLFPSIFRQDPRYFRRGHGSKGNRVTYALSRLVVTRAENGKSQFNSSKVLGILCSGALANTYYPENQRNAGRTFTTIGISFGTTAGLNLLKEFWPRKKK